MGIVLIGYKVFLSRVRSENLYYMKPGGMTPLPRSDAPLETLMFSEV